MTDLYLLGYLFTIQMFTGTSADNVKHLQSSNGVIRSPDSNRDGLYDVNVDLLWIIEAPDGMIIRYTIQQALIWYSADCIEDALMVSSIAS